MNHFSRNRFAIPAIFALLACGGDGGGGGGTGLDTGNARGSVVDGANGVQGASLTITKGASVRSATSNNAGEFVFNNIDVGSWTLATAVPNGFELASGEAGTRTFTVTSGQTTTISAIQLRAAAATTGTISGRVTNGAVGVPGATIRVSGVTASQVTDANGNFTFASVATGNRTVTLEPPVGFTITASESLQKQVTVATGTTETVNFSVQPVGATFDVAMTGLAFVPPTITVPRGSVVRWTNHDNTLHNATGASISTGDFATGSRSVTMHSVGTFAYQCTIHAGMNGTVVVQ